MSENKSGLKLSVLDQSPVPAGCSPGQALQNSIELARLVDGLGYTRYWMSEHHAMDTLACTAPEVPGNQRLHGARIDSGTDHRIAMAFSIAALRATGDTEIHGAEAAAISFPEFFYYLDELSQR